MINIMTAKRLIKRVILANISTDKKNLALTPLISGKHGIGKSQMIKSIASDINGICITIEGGTLKEGEITGLPYQYVDEKGDIKFRFLPYYAIDRIKSEEKRIYFEVFNGKTVNDNLVGDENKYSLNGLSKEEKIDAIYSKKIRPVILFIDEINRTENNVYKELMNILLTRTVNGYELPWWVFFVGAMNPSTQNSIYATNEMDPAQLDRFIKIKVDNDAREWIKYGEKANISEDILRFISANPKCLSSDDKQLEDEEKPTPSPRGWDMVDTLLNSEPLLRKFFTSSENDPKVVNSDMKALLSAKLGSTVATMFMTTRSTKLITVEAKEMFSDDEKLSKNINDIKKLTNASKIQLCNEVVEYLKNELDFIKLSKSDYDRTKKQMKVFIGCLDSSTKLLLAQKFTSEKTETGELLMDSLFEIFEEDLLNSVELSQKTIKALESKK